MISISYIFYLTLLHLAILVIAIEKLALRMVWGWFLDSTRTGSCAVRLAD